VELKEVKSKDKLKLTDHNLGWIKVHHNEVAEAPAFITVGSFLDWRNNYPPYLSLSKIQSIH
jgi:hypothetical protein